MLFEPDAGGFGATPFGTWFGASPGGGTWGLFAGSLVESFRVTSCESCSRVRIRTRVSGLVAFGSYVSAGAYYVVASDVGRSAACYQLRLDGPGGTYTAPFRIVSGVIPPIVLSGELDTAETLPAGASSASTLLRAELPEVAEAGEYTATLVDVCGEIETPLAVTNLEAEPMLLTPQNAVLNGLPEIPILLRRRENAAQPATGALQAIPFDYCAGVLEYDARLATLPGTQGWTHAGAGASGDFQLVAGRALVGNTATDSYWTKELVLTSAPTKLSMYGNTIFDAPAGGDGDGMLFSGEFAATAAAYSGALMAFRDDEAYITRPDLAGETALEWPTAGWNNFLVDLDAADARVAINSGEAGSYVLGTTGGPAGAHTLRATFGNVGGGAVAAYLRNFVVSAPGRFMRAWFTGFAMTSSPVLRLYLHADALPTADNTVRLLIRYGNTSDPYEVPALTTEQTVTFSSANLVYEIPITLSSLTANRPFRFTVERLWSHGADTMQSTMWLSQATLRAS